MKKFDTLLIDGDLLLHRCAAASEQEIDWGEGLHTLHSHIDDIRSLLTMQLHKYQQFTVKDPRIVICLSGSTNFRKNIDQDYKGHRTSRKPLGFLASKKFLQENYETLILEGFEADDLMGIAQTSKKYGRSVIVTDDKDLLQIPGYVLRPSKMEVVRVTPEAGHRVHMLQTLTGDRVDNYFGCPGVGAATADKILDCEPKYYWERVVSAYEKKGLTEKEALTQARLAKILTVKEYNRKKKEPILWSPSANTATKK